MKSKCERCWLRNYAERRPNALLSRIWRWHTGWCPGWNAYQKELAEKVQPRIFHVILMCLLLTFSVLGVSSCRTDTSSRQSFSQDVQDKLNKAVDAKMAEFGVPGVIVGVWVPGKGEWISWKGVSDIKTGTGQTIYDHVRIASITKTFTATMPRLSQDHGRLHQHDHPRARDSK